MEPLTGQALLEHINQHKSCGKAEIARRAGYFKTKEDGTVVPHIPQFMNAIAEANGIHIEGKRGASGARKRSYTTTCHATGIIMVGKTYTAEAGIQKGDKFKIEVLPGKIELIRVEQTSSPENEEPTGSFAGEFYDEEEYADDEELELASVA